MEYRDPVYGKQDISEGVLRDLMASDALRRLEPIHREAFHVLQSGLQRSSWSDVGAAATLSSRAHQTMLPNPLLESIIQL